MKFKLLIIMLFSIFLILSGCATILKGYEDKVSINTNEFVKIYDENNDELTVTQGIIKVDSVQIVKYKNKTGIRDTSYYYSEKPITYIMLRSNRTHTLTVETKDVTKKVDLYPVVGGGWVALDIICGVLPLVIDLYTGNLNHFDDIVVPAIGSQK